ncbi:MAG: hypothetical protein ACI4FY_03575 [Acetatifactor sp.]
MHKTIYEDYKYSCQDTSRIYVGCKYTFQELADAEDLNFKFRMLMQRYMLEEASPEDTLETHLYYLGEQSFLVKIYDQMKARVKVNVIEVKKHLLGKSRKEYTTKQLTVPQLAAMSVQEKERVGLVIQELSVSKLAIMGM